MLHGSLYAAILQSRSLASGLPALFSVPSPLLPAYGCSNAVKCLATAGAWVPVAARGRDVASRWTPSSPAAPAHSAAATAAAAAGSVSRKLSMSRMSVQALNNSSSSSSSSSSSWLSWLGVAAAGVVAQASVACRADAAAGAADAAWAAAALSSAELAVAEAWQEALLDHDRAAAQQQQQDTAPTAPGSSSSSSSSSAAKPLQPQVELQGQLLSVAIPILPTADVAGLIALIDEAVDALAAASSSSSCSQSTRLLGTSRVVQWESSRTQRQQQKGAGSSREQLRVQVMVPLQAGSPHEDSSSSSSAGSAAGYGRVSVVKPGSPFTADELALLAKLVAAANKPAAPGGGGGSLPAAGRRLDGSSSSSGGQLAFSPLARLLGGLATGLAGDLQSLEGDLMRTWQTLMDDLGGSSSSSSSGDGGSSSSSTRPRASLFGRTFSSLEELESHLEQQLGELASPDIVKWLQDFEQQARQQQQQQQQQHDFRGSSRDELGGSSRGSTPEPLGAEQEQAPQQPLQPWQQPAARSAVQQLQQLGAQVYLPSTAALAHTQQDGAGAAAAATGGESRWGSLAGYESQKQALEDYLLLPLQHPEVFERVASRTRKTAQPGGSRPRAVLFEGPPGTGKTSSARLLSRRVALPLVYVPLEALASKWYGESEQNMAKLFRACEALGGCVIFLDELDSLAGSRERADMHEASRRLLGVLLREIDGFDNTTLADSSSSSGSSGGGGSEKTRGVGQQQGAGSRGSVLIGATNRRQDLDAALLSRFSLSIHFGLPNEACRAAILQQYAHHLPAEALARIAAQTQGFSGRDLRDVCEQTERQWASRIIRGEVDDEQLPGEAEYVAAAVQRSGAVGGQGGAGRPHPWLDRAQVFKM